MRYHPPNTSLITSIPLPILIVEPNRQMTSPYCHLPQSYDITRVTSMETAFEQLIDNFPSLITISTSYSTHKILDFLNEVKLSSKIELIPIIFVVDLKNRISFVPGTFWAGKMSIWHSVSSQTEVIATLKKLISINDLPDSFRI